MSYGSYLERRKFGIYYFRQTVEVNGRQVVRRISLRTKDVRVAKLLALQMKARAAMVDPHGVRRFEVVWDENNNIKRLNVTDDADARNAAEMLKLLELHRAEQHKRELATKRVEAEIAETLATREKEAFANSEEGRRLLALYERLHELPEKDVAKPVVQPHPTAGRPDTNSRSLADQLVLYLADVSVKAGTHGKYRRLVGHLLAFGEQRGVTTVEGLTRAFVTDYRMHLKNEQNKTDATIRNLFYTLSSFYNWLLSCGRTTAENPFIKHRLKVRKSTPKTEAEAEERKAFSNAELEKIFSSPELLRNPKMRFICLLLLTSGARPNEICQLWTDDFDFSQKVAALRITQDEARDQSLKTVESLRSIYIHPLVLQAGIKEYLGQKKLGMAFELTRPHDKTYSTFISEEFTVLLRSLGISEKTMYCFRHTANTRLKLAGVNKEVREDLLGHAGEGTNAKHYSEGHRPAYLFNKTAKILHYSDVKAVSAAVQSRLWVNDAT